MSKQVRADGILLLVTLCWGVSYLLMDISLTDLDPFTLNSFRFLGAFAIAAAVSWKRVKTVNRQTLKYSLIVGIALVVVYIGATFGRQIHIHFQFGIFMCVDSGVHAFFCMAAVQKKPDKKLMLVVLMCFIGIALLTLGDDFSINAAHLKGDLLCIMCAVAYAADLVMTEKAVSHEEVDAYQLGVFQLGVAGVIHLILAFVTEQPHLPQTPQVWGAVLFLAIFCTGVAFVLQPIAQQYTTASHVGVIFTLEPVFSAIVAFLFAGEVLTPKAYFGAALMLASIFRDGNRF